MNVATASLPLHPLFGVETEPSDAQLRYVKARRAPVAVHPQSRYKGALLESARIDLSGAVREAREKGWIAPSAQVIGRARELLDEMFQVAPYRYEVYPTEEAGIAIDISDQGQGVLVICEAGGETLCVTNLERSTGHKRYTQGASLPDSYLANALRQLSAGR